MHVTFLGTAGYFPAEDRHTQSLLIREAGLIFDAGTGVSRLARLSVPQSLDIFLSHAHLDHICGLTYLVGLAHHCGIERITVYGEPEKLAAIETHLFSEFIFPVEPPFQWCPIEPGSSHSVQKQGLLTCFPLKHPGGSLGYRVDWPGRSFAYVTDTTAEPDADYIDSIRNVDLLVHECNFNADGESWARTTGHSWTTAVGQVAREANVKRLALLHVSPLAPTESPLRLEEVLSIFPATVLAHDLLELEF